MTTTALHALTRPECSDARGAMLAGVPMPGPQPDPAPDPGPFRDPDPDPEPEPMPDPGEPPLL